MTRRKRVGLTKSRTVVTSLDGNAVSRRQEKRSTRSHDKSLLQTGGQVDINKLLEQAPPIPRYLIRVHGQLSQGQLMDNTFLSADELHSIENNMLPTQIHHMSSRDFEKQVIHHLTNWKGTDDEPYCSVFISLTVSLRLALAWAQLRNLRGDQEVRIAVLDTTTIAQENCSCDGYCSNPLHENPILPAKLAYRSCNGGDSRSQSYKDEYIAFGHVKGKFKVSTFLDLKRSDLASYYPQLERLTRTAKYETLPDRLSQLWQEVRDLRQDEQQTVINIARRLSNDDLLIPMIAFVMCIQQRRPDDDTLLQTIVMAAGTAEKRTMFDFLCTTAGVHIFDFYQRKSATAVTTGGSAELIQTSRILEELPPKFTKHQHQQIKQQFACTPLALLCRKFCPRIISDRLEPFSISGLTGKTILEQAFYRLQRAVNNSTFGALRVVFNELEQIFRPEDCNAESWAEGFGKIAIKVEDVNETRDMGLQSMKVNKVLAAQQGHTGQKQTEN